MRQIGHERGLSQSRRVNSPTQSQSRRVTESQRGQIPDLLYLSTLTELEIALNIDFSQLDDDFEADLNPNDPKNAAVREFVQRYFFSLVRRTERSMPVQHD